MSVSRCVGSRVTVSILALLAGLTAVQALQVREAPSRFDAIAIPDPSVLVSPAALAIENAQLAPSAGAGWESFKTANGTAWQAYLDARSGAPLLVQGQGIPLIPGSGNALVSADPVTLDSLAAALRPFLAQHSALLKAGDAELVLSQEGSGQLTPDLWQVVFERFVAGIPVAGDRYVFHVGHGNLIAFGATRWSSITTDAFPSVSTADAWEILAAYMGLRDTEKVELQDRGTLVFLPLAAAGTALDSFEGAVGAGYDMALAWRFGLEVDGEPGKWIGVVDAHSGAVLALYDAIRYAQVKGGVFPLTDDGSCPDGCEQPNYPMPFADITIGANSSTAGSMGSFSCTPGGSSATTKLAGQYLKVSDTCGSISQSVTCNADLNLGTSSGTDCSVPAGASAGNTHASRSSFYHLNRIEEHARAWLPSNTWLTQQLTDNVNINNVCNAFWDDGGANGTVNFYRSGGGCRNTGEIAGVFLHEWGHGLDQNDGGDYDNPSEAYADITSLLLTHASCIGRGFRSTNCTGYGNACLSCTGVRDQDWNKRANHAAQTPENWPGSCPGGGGPCGKEEHCEAYLSGETLWDLAARDLPLAGVDQTTAWQVVDRLWYKSRTGSGGNAYGCGSPASNRSCGATSWFTKLRTIDDDDGNLANGTPHAAAIFAAFSRHNIPCGAAGDAANQSTSTCPALGTATPNLTGNPNAIALSWSAVAGASSYNVLRNDQGCGWGFTIIGNVVGTSFNDTNLPNNFPLYYSIQAVGSNSSCLGPLSACTSAMAGGPHASYGSNARVADTCGSGGAGNSDSIYDAGEQIQFSVTLQNDGIATLTGVTATLTPTTAGVTMLDATASYGNIAVGAPGTSLAPHFTAQLPASLACGASLGYDVTINTNQGSWTGSFSQTVGQPTPGGGTVLSENFSGGIPATWTVVNGGSGGGAAATWTTANPCNHNFTPPLVDPLAIVDSDCANSAQQDEQLVTPVLNLSTATSVALVYDEYFRWDSFGLDEVGDVDVKSSLTLNAWVNVVHNTGSSTSNPNHRNLDITALAAGASDVQVRFHYYNASNERYWEVDNVIVSYTATGSCNMHACTATTSANLGVTKSGSPGTVATGQNITYTVTVTNSGPDPAVGVQLSDTTPANTTFQSIAAPAGWNCSTPSVGGTGTISCTAPSLAVGAPAGFTVVVKVQTCAGNGTVISNTASVSSGTPDPNPGNGSASATTTVSDNGACNDGNACTQLDSCQGGSCVGSNPVVCPAPDQCHNAGTCSPTTGLCSNPAKPNGTTCNDGNGCSQPDTCQGGTCLGFGPAPNGTACSDGSACTQLDSCQGGSCVGSNPVVCPTPDQCHDAGTCSPATGQCSNPVKPDGTTCDDANPCTAPDSCTAGACGGTPITPPGEVMGLSFTLPSPDKKTMGWTAESGASAYDVLRGSLSGLPVGPGGGDEVCFDNVAGTTFVDATVPSGGFFYLVRAENQCGQGGWGYGSAFSVRSTSTCP